MDVGGPAEFVVQSVQHLLHELAAGLTHAPVPRLLAPPTTPAGHVDPVELVGRLERAASEGWQPWAYDLEQALLRLPRQADATAARRARRLGTPAGTRLADWLDAAGTTDPRVTRVTRVLRRPAALAVWIGPCAGDQPPVPAQQGGRCDQEARPARSGQDAANRGQQRPVSGLNPGTWDLATEHRELVAQHEDLQVLGGIAAGQQHKQLDGTARRDGCEVR